MAQRGRDLLRQADPATASARQLPSPVTSQEAINRFVAERKRDPEPFAWIADPDAIAEKVRHGYPASLGRQTG
jgi:hypothetical protein